MTVHIDISAKVGTAIRFPVDLDSAHDVFLTAVDLRKAHTSLVRAGDVAAALRAKREAVLDPEIDDESDDWGASAAAVGGRPDIGLFVDWMDLEKYETPPDRGHRLSDSMREACSPVKDAVQKKADNDLTASVSVLGAALRAKSGGRYRLGVVDYCVAVVDASGAYYPLQLDGKSYPALAPYGKKPDGFSNLQIEQIAATGLQGLEPKELETTGRRKKLSSAGQEGLDILNIKSLRSMASQTNRYFLNHPNEEVRRLFVRLIGGKLRILDRARAEHVKAHEALLAEARAAIPMPERRPAADRISRPSLPLSLRA